MNKIILVGGVYGSGKSTLGREMEGQALVVDYDRITGDGNGIKKTTEQRNSIRQETWNHLFLNALINSVRSGNPITIGIGTFTTRERRDRYFDALSKEGDVFGLYYMLPMRETIARIRNSRITDDKLVNVETVLEFYKTHNKVLRAQDNTDLAVPANTPKEYMSLLRLSGYAPKPQVQRWQVITKPLSVADIQSSLALPARLSVA